MLEFLYFEKKNFGKKNKKNLTTIINKIIIKITEFR